jgi:hypothetical protein
MVITCVKEKVRPVTLNITSPTVTTKYCGNNHKIDTELDVVTSTWNTVCEIIYKKNIRLQLSRY